MRALKVIALVIATLLVVLVLTAIGLWWWAGTQSSLDWTLARIAESQTIQAEGVEGSLRTGLKAKRIAWEKDGLKVEAFDAELAWQPLAIARTTVLLNRLHAARLRIEDKSPPKPKVIPVSLALPVRVEVDDVRVGKLEYVTGTQSVEATDIAGAYSYDAGRHNVKLAGLKWMQGEFSGEGSVVAIGRMPVEAKLQGKFAAAVPGSKATAPLAIGVAVEGPLAEMKARVQLEGTPNTATAGTSAKAALTVMPWQAQPVPQVQAEFQRLDAGALWAQAPMTQLSGKLDVKPAGKDAWDVVVDATNAAAGPWDQRKLPVEKVNAALQWRMAGVADIRQLHARAGGGTVDASGQWRTSGAWAMEGKLAGVDPGALHTAMAHLPIAGTAQLKGEGAVVDFSVDLKSSGTPRQKDIAQLEIRSAVAKGRWNGETLALPTLDVRMANATVVASGDFTPKTKSGSGKATIEAPGLNARAEGKVAQRSGGGTIDVRANDLAQALKWLARWPGIPDGIGAQVAAGRGTARIAWQGGWDDPVVQARIEAPQVTLAGPDAWTVRDATASVNGRLADAQLQLHARAEQAQRRVDVDVAGHGGRKGERWQGQLAQMNAVFIDPSLGPSAWALALQRAVDWRWAAGRFEAGAGQASLKSPRAKDAPAQLAWEPVRFGGGELQTAGRISGLPLGWIELFGGPQLSGSAVTGDMMFDAQWDARLGATPHIRASLARASGDVTVLAENAEGRSVRVPAGVREARIAVETSGDAVTATLRWDSEHGGTAEGRLATRLSRGGATGWQWPDNAPLNGQLRAQLPRIGVWSLLAPPGWRLRGSLQANVSIAGTKADPQANGTLAADDLALRSVVDGIEMQGGKLRAHLEGRRVLLDEFLLHGSGPNGGSLNAKGEGVWTATGPQATLTAELTKLRASIRSDRQVTVSGNVTARKDASGTVVNGKLHIDQALIVLPDQAAPKLGDDIVVRNAAAPITKKEAKAAEEAAKKPEDKLQVAIDVDMGDDFRVQGMGVDTRLRGTVALAAQSLANPRITGVIRARGGEYRAYGQRLDIERGIIRFTGAPDNPALDILAVRPNITQRVGVQVSGNALAPFVRLYSEPDLPDAEKLAWLVTGRPAPATGAESALVQQAALALLASRSGGGKQGIAASLGLDELSFRREGSEGPSLTLGKRFSRNFYAAYERSLSGAIGTLYIFYDVTRKLTLRGQAGERTALDLIYTFEFD
ncbi:translocation/assembly module TamB domain-containing protein [Ramlibacter sp. PS4R-6]|uniref:translocation/assembly module TamB domain-containing protein n=1 Tax=Ramlibacter sp. PS4R-6 TaxID=3133438 RepID=UPI0030B6AAD3